MNKNLTHIRYQNLPFLSEKVASGAMEIVQKELEESKIYSNEQKNKLQKIVKEEKEDGIKVINLTTNRKAILKYFPRNEEVVGRL